MTSEPSDQRAYRPSSLSTIEPIYHRAYRPSSLSNIEPINHRAYQPASLSTSALLSRLLSLSACCKRKLVAELSFRIIDNLNRRSNLFLFQIPFHMSNNETQARSDTCTQIVFDDTWDGPEVKFSASTGWYPQPRANQSLLQFLSESVTVGKTNIFLYFKSFFIESIKYFQGRDQEAADGDQTSEKREEDAEGETETGAAEWQSDRHSRLQRPICQSGATPTLTVMKTSWRRRRRLWLSNSRTRWPSDRRSASLQSQVWSGRLSLVDQVPWAWLVSRDMVDQDYHVTEIRSTLTGPRPTPDCPHGPEHPGQVDPGSQRPEVDVCCVSLVSLPR